MSVTIKYDGVEFFKSNKIATPMFSKSAEKDLKGINLGFKESYELSGQISSGSDSCDDFLELRKKQLEVSKLEKELEQLKALTFED